ncbi:MAG TPA: DegT/DnrJ/EryC1/StrS family aminotransferase, partial [Daejeonella sp.]|nr:DegT/DnrJ/EryC1/StrS family aminotransferase [Daejeonella sp.]
SQIQDIRLNPQKPGTTNGYWMPTVVFSENSGITREHLQSIFREADIDARVFFWPLSTLPPFSAKPANTPVAKSLCERAINLPSYHDMTTSEQDIVLNVLKQGIGN